MREIAGGDDGDRWVLLAVARDGETAEQWTAALADAGVDAQARIGDAVQLTKGSSFWPAMNPGDGLFAFPLFVRAEQRQEAASVLVDRGWDGRSGWPEPEGGRRLGLDVALPGALLATLVGALVALLLVLRGA